MRCGAVASVGRGGSVGCWSRRWAAIPATWQAAGQRGSVSCREQIIADAVPDRYTDGPWNTVDDAGGRIGAINYGRDSRWQERGRTAADRAVPPGAELRCREAPGPGCCVSGARAGAGAGAADALRTGNVSRLETAGWATSLPRGLESGLPTSIVRSALDELLASPGEPSVKGCCASASTSANESPPAAGHAQSQPARFAASAAGRSFPLFQSLLHERVLAFQRGALKSSAASRWDADRVVFITASNPPSVCPAELICGSGASAGSVAGAGGGELRASSPGSSCAFHNSLIRLKFRIGTAKLQRLLLHHQSVP